MWIQRYKLLMVVCGVGLVLGVREHLVNRNREPFSPFDPGGDALIEVISRVNPEDPETDYLRAMQALGAGNQEEFQRRVERILEADVKHNEVLLRFYAEYLIATGASLGQVNEALNRWHWNFPYSSKEIRLRLSSGPRSAQQARSLEHLLGQVRWISTFRLEQAPTESGPVWQLVLSFRRGEPIDIRQVDDALATAFPR